MPHVGLVRAPRCFPSVSDATMFFLVGPLMRSVLPFTFSRHFFFCSLFSLSLRISFLSVNVHLPFLLPSDCDRSVRVRMHPFSTRPGALVHLMLEPYGLCTLLARATCTIMQTEWNSHF